MSSADDQAGSRNTVFPTIVSSLQSQEMPNDRSSHENSARNGSRSNTTNYLYDGMNLAEEIDNTGNALARYTANQVVDQPYAMSRGATISYYEADGLGSITSLSNAAGALGNSYTYDSFGNLTASTGTLVNPFQYTGRDFDTETGLRSYRARYYDPAAGRFLSEDPVRFRGGTDFYAYASNNPTGWIDPFGLAPTWWDALWNKPVPPPPFPTIKPPPIL